MVLWWSSTKIVQDFLIRQKHGRQGAWLIFPIFRWWLSIKIIQAVMIRQKTWPIGDGAYFSYIIYIENFKNLIVRNHWIDFNVTWQKQKMDIVTLFQDCSSRHDSSKQFGRQGLRWVAGLIFPIYLYRKLSKSSFRNRWTDFNITLQKCFLCNLLPRLFKQS